MLTVTLYANIIAVERTFSSKTENQEVQFRSITYNFDIFIFSSDSNITTGYVKIDFVAF